LGSLDTEKLTEEQARTLDHKWSPVRHHVKVFRNVRFDGDNLRVYGRCYVRDLFLHSYTSIDEVPEMMAVFVLTLGTGDNEDEIYNELRDALGAFVETAIVDFDIEIDQ
jgi:hypothetical protein